MKVSEASKLFFDYGHTERGYALSTQAKHLDCFVSWVLPLFGDNDVTDISRLSVLRLREIMGGRGLSLSRQGSVLASLRSFLHFCSSVLKIQCLNPAEVSLPKIKPGKVEALDNGDIRQMWPCLHLRKFTHSRLRAFIELGLATGMRLSEMLSLDRQPFDDGATEMDIIGKGRKQRTVFFSERCLFWITKYLAARADNHPALFITTGDPPRRWSGVDVSAWFRWLKKEAGITKRFTAHMLRHTFCTNLLNNGADITFIKELAGHESIETTAKYYLGVDKSALRRIVRQRLDYEAPAIA